MSIVFDRAVPFYDQTRGLPPEAQAWMTQALREHTPLHPGSRLLEIGVGTGRIALPLVRENGYRYTGVDLSSGMLRALQTKPDAASIRLARADATCLPLREHIFDAVVVVHVFHLIDHWQRALDEIMRVLHPAGLLLHGYSRHERDAPAQQLRSHMLRAAEVTGQDRVADAYSAINDVLQHRIGSPQRHRSPIWDRHSTPHEVIRQFEARTWSSTWAIADQRLAQAAELGRRWAIERWNSLDTPISNAQRFVWDLYGLERAGAYQRGEI